MIPSSQIVMMRSEKYHWRIQVGCQERAPRGPNSFIFMQFSATNLKNNRLAHPLWEFPPSQQSPGSTTEFTTCTARA